MKTKYVILGLGIFLFFQSQCLKAQTRDYRKDSLQFKMYTRMFINEQLQVDSIRVKKIFCDYCTEQQLEVLHNEALQQSALERHNPKYRKAGEHRLALLVRFSKEDFKRLNKQQ